MGRTLVSPQPMTIFRFDSPFGPISYQWQHGQCMRIWLDEHPEAQGTGNDPVADWLHAYFQRCAHPLPPLVPPGSHFQARLRIALWQIPPGTTSTYGSLARMLNSAPRAVGQALAANPVPLLVPCHRIIGARGPGGFTPGARWKQTLLAFERGDAHPDAGQSRASHPSSRASAPGSATDTPDDR